MKRKQVAILIAGAAVVGAAGIGASVYLSQDNKNPQVDEVEVVSEIESTQEASTASEEDTEEEEDKRYEYFMQSHLIEEDGSYTADDELMDVLLSLKIAEGSNESEINWWMNQEGDFGLWAETVCGTDSEQTLELANQRLMLLEDLGDVSYRIHDEYVKAHQSSGSSSSSTQKPSNGSNNSSNNSSNGNGGSSSSNGGNSSSTPTPAPTPAPSGNSSSDSDYNPEFDDGAPNEQGTGNGGSSGNDFGGCITWR